MPRRLLTALVALLPLPAAALDWQATERTEHYAVSGDTGIALYRSIGENGPKLSTGTRTIAVTDWSLKWGRDYRPAGNACTLESVRPFLVITYKLPKAKQKLSAPVAARWKAFTDGMAEHEKVHGVLLRAMTDEVIRDTLGLTVDNDPKCQKIRAEVKRLALEAYDRYRTASRDFDRVEMGKGGNVERLILGLVN